MNTSIMDQDELDLVVKYLDEVKHLEGHVAEVGVYKGGSFKVLAQAVPEKTVYGFDSFAGVTNAVEREEKEGDNPNPKIPRSRKGAPELYDGVRNGRFTATEANVPDLYEFVKDYLKDCPNAVIVPGYFPDTTTNLVNEKFCFAHFDADTYRSTMDFMEFFYPRMTTGGIMMFHDFNFYLTGLRVQLAVEEFMKDKPEKVESPNKKQAIIRKVSLKRMNVSIMSPKMVPVL